MISIIVSALWNAFFRGFELFWKMQGVTDFMSMTLWFIITFACVTIILLILRVSESDADKHSMKKNEG